MECKFCQNWNISQFRPEQLRSWYMPPERLLDLCGQYRCQSLAFTYSEPVIFYEYMYDASAHVKPEGIHPVMISNGFIEPEPMKQLAPNLSAVKIDLKAFTEKFYDETCGGHLQPVLDTLVLLKELGLWFEIVVLIVPTLNDGEEETRRMCGWIHKNLGPDVPLHFSRYHPTYKIQNIPPTPLKTLEQHHAIAIESGLHYVYLGNLPGHQSESTCCPACGKVVIGRYGYHISSVNLSDGKCSHCSHPIAGVWV
jgi:pyruvate formate lyase activating enzyme